MLCKAKNSVIESIIIILQWYPKQNLKQLKEQDLKY